MNDKMIGFIVRSIKEARDKNGLEAGQNKYRAWFINVSWYANYKSAVDAILTIDDYDDCIVVA